MAKKVSSVKPSIFSSSQDNFFSILQKPPNRKPIQEAYKTLRRAFKSCFHPPGKYFLISKQWLKRWKSSKEGTFAERFNDDIVDFQKNKQGFEGVDCFLKPKLVMKRDYIVIDLDTQNFFDRHFEGRRIQRYFHTLNEDSAIYPLESPLVVITEECLKEVEYGHLKSFQIRLVQLDLEGMNYEDLKTKYFPSLKKEINDREKTLRANNIRIWKVCFSQAEEIVNSFRESCKKCIRNYCFYMPFGRLIQELQEKVVLKEDEGLIFDIKEQDVGFHLIPPKIEEIFKCDYCFKLTTVPLCCPCNKVTYCGTQCQQKDLEVHSKHCDKATLNFDLNDDENPAEMTNDSVKGVCGLQNLGNTCYMNSALQCLSNCFDFSQYFLSKRFRKDLNKKNTFGSQGKTALTYAEFIQNMWCGGNNIFTPSVLKSQITNRFFGESSQEDSQEFLVYLLDLLHEDLKRRSQLISSEKEKERGVKENPTATECWRGYMKMNNSFIMDTFGGLFKSKILCPNCEKVSVTYDPFLVCPLPIPLPRMKTLSLKLVRKESQLEIENIRYRYLSEGSFLSEMVREVQELFSAEFELFEWDKKSLIPVTEEKLKMTDMLRKQLKERQASLLAFEKFKKEAPQALCLLFFYKQTNSGILGSPSKTAFGNFPRLLPLFFDSPITPQKLHYAVAAYLKFFLDVMEKSNELKKSSSDKTPNFISKLFSSNKSSYPFKLVLRSTEETLNPSSSQVLSEKLIEIEVVWIEEPPKTFERSFDSYPYPKEVGIPNGNNEEKKTISLNDCLRSFSQEESLDEQNQWQCPGCKSLQKASKKMEIYQSPQVLVFQLKRFKSNKTLQKSKITDLVEFPVEKELDMSNFVINHELPERLPVDYINEESDIQESIKSMSSLNRYGRLLSQNGKIFQMVHPKKLDDNEDLLFEEDEIVTISTENTFNKEKSIKDVDSLNYELIGVVEHSGNLGYGHYIAKCKNEFSKKWHEFNDSSVMEIEATEVTTRNAYLLFYKRKKN